MSKSKHMNHQPPALRRRARSLNLKPLDFDRSFIDVLIDAACFGSLKLTHEHDLIAGVEGVRGRRVNRAIPIQHFRLPLATENI